MIEAKMTRKGQITLPKKLRDLLNLHTGDRVMFILRRDGTVLLTTQTVTLNDMFGAFDYKSKGKLTKKDIHNAISKRMRRKYK